MANKGDAASEQLLIALRLQRQLDFDHPQQLAPRMSFIIAIHTSEGIVLAADSRLTLNVKVADRVPPDLSIEFSNATRKLFCTRAGVGIATCGDAGIQGKPIAGFIEQFAREHAAAAPIEVADKLTPFMCGLQPNLNATFFVGGYDRSGVQQVFRVYTKAGQVDPTDTSKQGVTWAGEGDIVARLIQDVYEVDRAGLPTIHLTHYSIPWNFFSLQDAIDFAKFAMEATISAIRFQDRPKTVGGPVDLLVIEPERAKWVQRKELLYPGAQGQRSVLPRLETVVSDLELIRANS